MQQRTKKLNICLYGNTGRDNIADELKLATALKDIQRNLGEQLGVLTVLTRDVSLQRRFIDSEEVELIQFTSAHMANPVIWLKNVDVLVLVGDLRILGNLSALERGAVTALLKAVNLLQKRIVIYGCHLDTLQYGNSQAVKNTMRNVDLVMLAGPDSIALMKEHGVTNEMYCTASTVYQQDVPSVRFCRQLLEGLKLDGNPSSLMAVFLHDFFPELPSGLLGSIEGRFTKSIARRQVEADESRARYVRQMATYCDWLVDTYDADIALATLKTSDEAMIERVYQAMRRKGRTRQISNKRFGPDELSAILSASRLQVTSHICGLQMGSAYGLPSLGIGNNLRLESLFRQMGIIEYYIDYVTPPNAIPNTFKLDDILVEQTLSLMRVEDAVRERLTTSRESFRKRSLENGLQLKNCVERKWLPGRITATLRAVRV